MAQVQFTVRNSFPGGETKENGVWRKNLGLAGGGENATDVKNCIENYYNNGLNPTDTTVENFYRCYGPSSKSTNNAYVRSGSGLYPCDGPDARKAYVGNCTAYVWGRVYEIYLQIKDKLGLEKFPTLPTCNGGADWYNNASNLERGPIPLAGAVACTKGQHVGIIESVQYNDTGNVIGVAVSQSSYSAKGHISDDGFGFIFTYTEDNAWKASNNTLQMSPLYGGTTLAGFVYPFGRDVHEQLTGVGGGDSGGVVVTPKYGVRINKQLYSAHIWKNNKWNKTTPHIWSQGKWHKTN